MDIKKIWSKYSRYIISSLAVVFGYPLIYLMQNQQLIPGETFLLLIPTAFILTGTLGTGMSLFLSAGDKE